ncbi:MAG: four helix bundle protein [Candidatus Scalinduaceae bacterium]
MAQIIEKPIGPEVSQIPAIFRIAHNKIKICESEASETQYWIEVIVEVEWLSWKKVKSEYEECSELLAIFTSIKKK